ncbi:hypothetical protein C0J52_02444 [Blattella germanica]|nr:hypothetical protein C0J52_02444 [Blattella germanica]
MHTDESDDLMTEDIFGKRPVGKPKKRWTDSVKDDRSYQILNCKNWHQRVQYREGWRSRIKKS